MKNLMKLFAFVASLFGATTPAAETKLVNPKSILFSTSTLNDALPAYASNAAPGQKLLQIHEDDWRQFEAVSTGFTDAISQELNAIRKIHETASVKTKVGDRELTAFRSIHVRKLITDPIPARLKLSSIAALAENRGEYTGLSLSGSPPVVGGYALSIDGLILFGQADGDRVLSLCFVNSGPPKIAAEKARRLVSLFQENHLVLIHWPSATKLELNEFIGTARDDKGINSRP